MINTLAVLFHSTPAVAVNPTQELPFILNRLNLIVPRLQKPLPLAQASSGDPTVPSTETQGDGILDIVLSGGPIGVVIVLILIGLSVSTAYLLFDQIMTLRRRELIPDGIADSVRQALLTGRVSEADAACRRSPSVLSVVLLSGLSEIDFGWREVEKAVEDSLTQQASRLMRKIEYLSVFGNISPMVGLLGTVTGMIFAFQQVATTRGAAGAGGLAEGIYQALVTTVGGLVVAIPSLAIYAVCRNRVDNMIAEIAYQSQVALAPIKRRPTRTTRPNSAAQTVGTGKVATPKANTGATLTESSKESPPKGPKSPPVGSSE